MDQNVFSAVIELTRRDILYEMLLPIRPRVPEIPRDNIRLQLVAEPASIGDSAYDALGLVKRRCDSGFPESLVGRERLFWAASGHALLHPLGEATGKDDGIFKHDTSAFALWWHGVLILELVYRQRTESYSMYLQLHRQEAYIGSSTIVHPLTMCTLARGKSPRPL
jgi:hypothetical protein